MTKQANDNLTAHDSQATSRLRTTLIRTAHPSKMGSEWVFRRGGASRVRNGKTHSDPIFDRRGEKMRFVRNQEPLCSLARAWTECARRHGEAGKLQDRPLPGGRSRAPPLYAREASELMVYAPRDLEEAETAKALELESVPYDSKGAVIPFARHPEKGLEGP